MNKARRAELDYIKEKNCMEIAKAKDVAQIEVAKFKEMVESIGANNLTAMAAAGPDHQVNLVCSKQTQFHYLGNFGRIIVH
jgi:hypothetical protein